LNFNADGDKILTGSFDGTAIVLIIIFRYGTLNQESQSMYYRGIQDKYLALNFNLEDTCAELLPLIKLAVYGMSEQENACLF
jgi:hypothetical protein